MRITFSGLRLAKGAPRRTARHTWELIGRTCAPQVLLVETYGGYPKGYVKAFNCQADAHSYIRARLAKKGYVKPGEQPDGDHIVEWGMQVPGETFHLTDQRHVSDINVSSGEHEWDSTRLIWKDIRDRYMRRQKRKKATRFEVSTQEFAQEVLNRVAETCTSEAGKLKEFVREINSFVQPEGMGGALYEPLASCLTIWADIPEVEAEILESSALLKNVDEARKKRPVEKKPEPQYARWGAWS